MGLKDLGYSAPQFLNTVRLGVPQSMQSSIPVIDVNQTDFKGIGDVLEQGDYFANVWHKSALNLVAKILQRDNKIVNPLAEYEGELVEDGAYIEEIMLDVAEMHQFSPTAAEKRLFERRPPELKSVLHKRVRDVSASKTFQDTFVTQIFNSVASLDRYVINITESMLSGNEQDKYYEAKKTVSEAVFLGRVRVIDLGTNVTAKQLQKAILRHSKRICHPGRFYNMGNVGQPDNHGRTGLSVQGDKSKLRLMLPVDTAVDLNTDFFASAYHLDAVESGLAIKEIDEFPNIYQYTVDHVVTQFDLASKFVSDYKYQVGDVLPAGTDATEEAYLDSLDKGKDIELKYDASRIKALIHDKRTLMINPVLPTTFGSTPNSLGRYINISLQAKEFMTYSPFLPSVVILADMVDEDAVINPPEENGIEGAEGRSAAVFSIDSLSESELLDLEKQLENRQEVKEEPTETVAKKTTTAKKATTQKTDEAEGE